MQRLTSQRFHCLAVSRYRLTRGGAKGTRTPNPLLCKVMACAALRLVEARSVTAKLAEHRRMVAALLHFAAVLVPPERDKQWGISAARLRCEFSSYLVDGDGSPRTTDIVPELRAAT
jgi:hypothetical protein